MNLDEISPVDLNEEIPQFHLGKLVPKVNGLYQPAPKRRKSERSKTFRDGFSLPWDEFETMTKRELWEMYVKVILKRNLIQIKTIAKRRKTRIKFFRFTPPMVTMNQRVLTFDRDGIFFCLVFKRCAHQTHRDRVTPVVEVEFIVEVGEFDR